MTSSLSSKGQASIVPGGSVEIFAGLDLVSKAFHDRDEKVFEGGFVGVQTADLGARGCGHLQDFTGDAVALVEQCPDTLFIVDHCGNADPQIVSGDVEPDLENPFSHDRQQWMDDMQALGAHDNVVCKLSGIVARAPQGWKAETLAPTVEHCIASFGADGVVFGGDWPVCTLGAPLGEWVAALRQIVKGHSEEDQRRILHDNAVRLYGLA